MSLEENSVLSSGGDVCWPMDHYALIIDDHEFLTTAIEDAREEHADYEDMESKLRLGGLELLKDALNGK